MREGRGTDAVFMAGNRGIETRNAWHKLFFCVRFLSMVGFTRKKPRQSVQKLGLKGGRTAKCNAQKNVAMASSRQQIEHQKISRGGHSHSQSKWGSNMQPIVPIALLTALLFY